MQVTTVKQTTPFSPRPPRGQRKGKGPPTGQTKEKEKLVRMQLKLPHIIVWSPESPIPPVKGAKDWQVKGKKIVKDSQVQRQKGKPKKGEQKRIQNNKNFPPQNQIYIDLRVNNTPVEILLDTGAQASLVNVETLKAIPGFEEFRDAPKGQKLLDHQLAEISQEIEPKLIPVTLQGRTVLHPFFVTSSPENIMGLDLIQQLELQLTCRKNKCTLTMHGSKQKIHIKGKQNAPGPNTSILTRNVTLEGKETKTIAVLAQHVNSLHVRTPKRQPYLVTAQNLAQNSPIQVSPGTTRVEAHQGHWITVRNISDSPITLPKGYHVASLKSLPAQENMTIDPVYSDPSVVEEEEPPGYDVGDKTIKSIDEVLQEADLSGVPEEHRQDLLDYMKNETPGVFSRGQNDIGLCTKIPPLHIEAKTTGLKMEARAYPLNSVRRQQMNETC